MKTAIIAILLLVAIIAALVYTIKTAPRTISRSFRRWRRSRRHRKQWNDPAYRREWFSRYARETETPEALLPAPIQHREQH